MSNLIDSAVDHFPVFGMDVFISVPDLAKKIVITGLDITTSAEKAIFRNGVGDTKARVWYDIAQATTVKLDATVIGADAATAGGNNNPTTLIPIGTEITLTSPAKFPSLSGKWFVDDITSTGTNTGFAAWSISIVPKVT